MHLLFPQSAAQCSTVGAGAGWKLKWQSRSLSSCSNDSDNDDDDDDDDNDDNSDGGLSDCARCRAELSKEYQTLI